MLRPTERAGISPANLRWITSASAAILATLTLFAVFQFKSLEGDVADHLLPRVQALFGATIFMGFLSSLYLACFVATARRARSYRWSALQDSLTNVHNRRGAIATLEHHIASETPFGIIFLDLDGFKKINDVSGHAAGDVILKAVASRLVADLRDNDTVCRMGGDEFICIIAPLQNLMSFRCIADRLWYTVTRPYSVEGDDFVIGCSLGLSMYPHDGTTPDVLLAKADRAMYEAKRLASA